MAEQNKKKLNQANASTENTPSAAATMQDLYKKMRSEKESAAPVSGASETDKPAPKYDEARAVSTRKQLMEDYRRELEALGKDEKRTASRTNLYEYEEILPEEEEKHIETVEESVEVEAEEPVETAEESIEVEAEAPVETVEEPVEVEAEAPVETVEASVEDEVEAPVETVEESVEVEAEAPVETVEASVEVEVEAPVETVEESVEDEAEAPVETVEESIEVEAEAPVETVEEPVEVEVEEPAETTEESVEDEAEAPAETAEESVEVEAEEPVETVEESVENETDETVEEVAFRPLQPYLQKGEKDDPSARRIEPSKRKDPYSAYDHDMAQEFGYIPASREQTVTKTNEMDGPREHFITIFSKPASTADEEPQKEDGRRRRIMTRRNDRREERSRQTKQTQKTAPKTQKKRTIPEPRRISEEEDARIRSNPNEEKAIALRRLIGAGMIAVILLFWEYLPLIPGSGYLLFGLIGNTQYPFLYIGIAALLLLIGAAFLGRSFLYGFCELAELRCTPRSLTAFAVTLALLNDIFSACILFMDPAVDYGMFHFPAAIFILLYAVGHYCSTSRKGDVYTVFGALRTKYLLVSDDLGEHIANRAQNGAGSRLCRFTAKSEVTGTEKRLSTDNTYAGFPGFRILFFWLVLLGMGAMLVSSFLSGGETSMLSRVSAAVQAFLWTVFFATPLAVTEVRRIPLMRISKEMRKKNTAIAGDRAAEEYAAMSHVAVRSELFFRKHPFSLGECVGRDPERLRYYISAIFSELGSPFSKAIVSEKADAPSDKPETDMKAEAETAKELNVRLLLVAERSVKAYVDGVLVELRLTDDERAGYLFSDPGAALREFAYRIPFGILVEGETHGVCSVYVQNDAEYPSFVRALDEHGLKIDVCHYTFLPFLNEKTLQVPRVSQAKQKPTVLNLSEDEAASRMQKNRLREESADSGIAALNAPKDLWLPLVYAEKIASYNRFSAVLAWISVIVGSAFSFCSLCGLLPIALYPVWALVLPSAFGALTYLLSRFFLS